MHRPHQHRGLQPNAWFLAPRVGATCAASGTCRAQLRSPFGTAASPACPPAIHQPSRSCRCEGAGGCPEIQARGQGAQRLGNLAIWEPCSSAPQGVSQEGRDTAASPGPGLFSALIEAGGRRPPRHLTLVSCLGCWWRRQERSAQMKAVL